MILLPDSFHSFFVGFFFHNYVIFDCYIRLKSDSISIYLSI